MSILPHRLRPLVIGLASLAVLLFFAQQAYGQG